MSPQGRSPGGQPQDRRRLCTGFLTGLRAQGSGKIASDEPASVSGPARPGDARADHGGFQPSTCLIQVNEGRPDVASVKPRVADPNGGEVHARILVALDGSEHSDKALDLASDIAGKYGAELVLLHVMSDKPLTDGERYLAETEMWTISCLASSSCHRWRRFAAARGARAPVLRRRGAPVPPGDR